MEIKEVQITDSEGNIYVSVKQPEGHNGCLKCCFYKEQKENWMQGCPYASDLCEEKYFKKKKKGKPSTPTS